MSVYARGQKRTYWMRFRFAGRIIHESARTTSKVIAREAERNRRRELANSWNRIEKRTLPPTVTEAAKLWLVKRASLATGTRETYEAALVHVKSALGHKLVCEIQARDVVGYQRARLAEEAAGATINKEVACLSSILSEYGVWIRIRRDVKKLAENEEAGRALSKEEEGRLLRLASKAGEHQGHWTPLYTVTTLGLNTGMRHKEIRTLRWKHVDLASRVLRVGESKTDAGKGRAIPLTQPAWAALEVWASRFPNRQPEDFIFPACENGKVNPERPISNWRTAWRNLTRAIRCPACESLQEPGQICSNEKCKADIRDVKSSLAGLRFHDLRHTAATNLLEQGTPLAVVAQILGWSASTAVRMAKRYGHIRPETQRLALDAIATIGSQSGVNQIDNQMNSALESQQPN